MDAGLLSSIIGGATNLTGSFLNFGASIYATNHQDIPEPGDYNYNIVLPQTAPDTTGSLQMVALVVVLLIVLLVAGYLIYKYS